MNGMTYPSLTLPHRQVVPKKEAYTFKTQRKVPKTGLMLVGWGGNNGTTTTAGATRVVVGWDSPWVRTDGR